MHFAYAQYKQKGFVPILIVLLIAALVGGYFTYTNSQTKTPPPTPQPSPSPADETASTEQSRSANWKAYENSKYTFTIKYPAEWIYSERDNNSQISFDLPTNKDSDGKVLGKIELLVNSGTELLPENLNKSDLINMKNTNVGEIKVQEVHHHVCPSNGDCIALFFKSGNNTFYLHSNADSEGYTNLPTLYQMISSFKSL